MAEKTKKFKKTKLNYMSAVSHIQPKATIAVSSAKIEELNRAVKEKTRQNMAQSSSARDNFKDDIFK